MKYVPFAIAAGLAVLSSMATAQETVLTERSATDRVANWYFTNQSAAQINTLTDSLTGTRSVLKEEGDVFVAIIWNASPSESGFDVVAEFGGLIEDGVDAVATWPSRDLWADYGYSQD